MELKVNITKGGAGDTFYAEAKLDTPTVIGIHVVGMGDTVGAALADLGTQIGPEIDEQVDA